MKNRPVLLTLFAVVLVDIVGYTIVLPLLPFYAESFGATPFVVGSIVACFALAQMISGPILGRLSDKYGRRPVLIFSQLGTLLSFILLARSTTLWMVFVARIVDGLTAGNLVVAQAYVADVTSREERSKAMGLIGAAFGLGFVLGPSLSAFFSGYSPHAPIWAAACISGAAITGSFFILKEPERKKSTEAPGFKRMSRWQAMRDPLLRTPLLAFFFFSLAFAMLISGLALFSERVLQWNGKAFGQREVGWIFTYGGAMGLIIQTLLIGPAVKWAGERKLASLGFLSIAVGFVLIGVSPMLWVFIIGYTLVQAGSGFTRPSLNGFISKNAPGEAQGFIFGVTQTLMALAQIIAPLMSGAWIQAGHYSWWAWSASVVGAMGLILLFLVRSQPQYKHAPQVVTPS